MQIVIADDAGFVVEILQSILTENGHQVVAIAATAQEAIELTLKLRPDVLFLDLVMPHSNGLEAAIEILNHNPQQNIITCSSLSEAWIQQKAIDCGCKFYLTKPFNKNEVIESLRHIDLSEKGKQHG